MKALEQEVQQEPKAAMDWVRVDTTFLVGDQMMLLTKQLLDAAELGKLRPPGDGPLPVAAVAGPRANTYTLSLSERKRHGSRPVRRSTSTGSSPTSLGRADPPPPALSLTRARRRRTWCSSSSTARRSVAGPTTWCYGELHR